MYGVQNYYFFPYSLPKACAIALFLVSLQEKKTQMNPNKTVSVVMCTFNGERYVREQLDSIVAQTYPIHELIIEDDGSTDRTVEICREYASRYPFIRVVVNERNLGLDANFEAATMRSTGDFVALSDQDDVWYPEKISRQVAAIGDNDICFSCYDRGADRQHSTLVCQQYRLEALLFAGFAGHTMLLRGDFARTHEHWALASQVPFMHYDWSLAVFAQLKRGIIRIDEALNLHRCNPQSAITKELETGPRVPAYMPYTQGLREYRRMQSRPEWQRFYSLVFNRTSDTFQPLAHRMSGLMLRPDGMALLRLCGLCCRHRATIYWNGGAHGVMGKVRGFCYPLIFAYNNKKFYQDQ